MSNTGNKDRKKMAAYGAMLAVIAVIAGLIWGSWDPAKVPQMEGPVEPGVVREPAPVSVGSTTGQPLPPGAMPMGGGPGPLGPGGALGPGGPRGPGD